VPICIYQCIDESISVEFISAAAQLREKTQTTMTTAATCTDTQVPSMLHQTQLGSRRISITKNSVTLVSEMFSRRDGHSRPTRATLSSRHRHHLSPSLCSPSPIPLFSVSFLSLPFSISIPPPISLPRPIKAPLIISIYRQQLGSLYSLLYRNQSYSTTS